MSQLIWYLSCPRPRVCCISKEPWFPYREMVLGDHSLALGVLIGANPWIGPDF